MKFANVKNGVVVAISSRQSGEYAVEVADGIQLGMSPTATDAELAAAQVAIQATAAQAAAIASIYEPVAYNGKSFPVDPESMAKYELAKQSRGRGKMTKAIAIATDGTVVKLTGTAAIDAFHGAMEDAILARVDAIHDAI